MIDDPDTTLRLEALTAASKLASAGHAHSSEVVGIAHGFYKFLSGGDATPPVTDGDAYNEGIKFGVTFFESRLRAADIDVTTLANEAIEYANVAKDVLIDF